MEVQHKPVASLLNHPHYFSLSHAKFKLLLAPLWSGPFASMCILQLTRKNLNVFFPFSLFGNDSLYSGGEVYRGTWDQVNLSVCSANFIVWGGGTGFLPRGTLVHFRIRSSRASCHEALALTNLHASLLTASAPHFLSILFFFPHLLVLFVYTLLLFTAVCLAPPPQKVGLAVFGQYP